MDRREFLSVSTAMGAMGAIPETRKADEAYAGVWKFTFGQPEKITPVSTRHYQPSPVGMAALTKVSECPVQVRAEAHTRGMLVRIPLQPDEMVYGLGLQFQSFQQRGCKKQLRVNADPKMDTGDSHAPVPFYVTTRGYGVLIDTARYATVYAGNKHEKGETKPGEQSEVLVEIPRTKGITVYVFGGPTPLEAVQRYNLFSGGGPLPPRWGLGVWYRCDAKFGQAEVVGIAEEFRQRKIPCDVIGLEPGWQTHSYSCTYLWSDLFPNPGEMIGELGKAHYRLNLWEHAFTNPASPLHETLLNQSGNYTVWGGLAPDFLSMQAREAFGAFHEKAHVSLGVAGYKLDECDNSDFTGNWSFPEISAFPSGADGEQMHSLFGLRYQDALQTVFERRQFRTYGLVRSSGALAAPYPYVLYSDLYDHSEFIRALVNSGFSGLLWTPEVRDAASEEDLIRRLQTAVLSPMALINAWYIKNPPWKQLNRAENNAGHLGTDWEQLEARCRLLLELRMQLVPYLHAAFVRYRQEGIPPVRALVLNYPGDPQTFEIDDQYLLGDSIMVAPVTAGHTARSVYLPDGIWHDFWSDQKWTGKQKINVEVPLERIPMFVKSGNILPLASVSGHTEDKASWEIHAQGFGDGMLSGTVFEDDGGFKPVISEVRLEWQEGAREGRVSHLGGSATGRYSVVEWRRR